MLEHLVALLLIPVVYFLTKTLFRKSNIEKLKQKVSLDIEANEIIDSLKHKDGLLTSMFNTIDDFVSFIFCKYCLIDKVLTLEREKGGLGLDDLRVLNKVLNESFIAIRVFQLLNKNEPDLPQVKGIVNQFDSINQEIEFQLAQITPERESDNLSRIFEQNIRSLITDFNNSIKLNI